MKLTLQQMIGVFRNDAKDNVQPYMWENEQIKQWLNEAEQEATVRRRLLHESDSEEICVITLIPGKRTYPLNPLLYELTWLNREEDNAQPVQLSLVSVEWLDRNHPGWRSQTEKVLPFAVQDETSIRLATPPKEAGLLRLEGYRLPTRPLDADDDTPEIHNAHHEKLILWALHRAFSQPDADGFDPQRADRAELEFTEYFGLRPDADLRRNTREDVEQVNVAYI